MTITSAVNYVAYAVLLIGAALILAARSYLKSGAPRNYMHPEALCNGLFGRHNFHPPGGLLNVLGFVLIEVGLLTHLVLALL